MCVKYFVWGFFVGGRGTASANRGRPCHTPAMRTLPLLILAACADKGGGGDGSAIATEAASLVTGPDGLAELTVPISGERSFLITGGGSSPVALEALRDPEGRTVVHWRDWLDAETSITSAWWPLSDGMTFNWPHQEDDGALAEGDWTVVLSAYDWDYVAGADVEAVVQINRDDAPREGAVKVALIYARGISSEAGFTEAVDYGVEHWRTLWAPHGLDVEVRTLEGDFDRDLPYPGYEAEGILRGASALTDDDEIAILLGETIDGSLGYYGVAGNIPGPLITTDVSGVVMSWLTHSGRDGVFSEDERRAFGETLAHEVGHYMGLFHPVESDYRYWDALSDTPRCEGRQECEESLGENLMFPYSICDWTTCQAVWEITDDQAGVSHRYTGTQ